VPAKPAKEIALCVVMSEPDGSFTIPFIARPDPSVPPKDEPSFRYTVTADVTDTTGETRTGTRSVNVGYVALHGTGTPHACKALNPVTSTAQHRRPENQEIALWRCMGQASCMHVEA